MAFEEWAIMLIWLTFGAVVGMLYVLRRIFLLEKKILNMDKSVLRMEKIQIKLYEDKFGKKKKTTTKKKKKK